MSGTVIFEERDKWTGPIVLSIGFHLLLVVAALIGGYFSGPHGENWGGSTSGTAMQVSLAPTIPLPSTQEPTQNIVANDSKGLTQSVPQQQQEEQNALPIPETIKPKQQKPAITHAPDIHRPVTPPQENVVPYGQGGPINTSVGTFTLGQVQGGFNIEGDFGTRFAYYVAGMKRKVTENWYNPGVAGAQGHKVFISFDISRNGTSSNVRLEQSSNIPVLDQSALQALQRIDSFDRLPDAYSGSSVHVELWFEPTR